MYHEEHGGECCGIRHIMGFGLEFDADDARYLRRITKAYRADGVMCEIVLTNEQMEEMPELLRVMKKLQYQRVSRFRNGNSGNVCNVFHSHKRTLRKLIEY